MRRDWLSTHVAAVVAAPLVLASQPAEAPAAPPEVAKLMAQASTTAPTSAVPAGAEADTTETTTTEEMGEFGAAEAPVSLDGEVLPPAVGTPLFEPRGDDELPTEAAIVNNPYLRAATLGMQQGQTLGEQEYGAFIPPAPAKVEDKEENVAGSEMRSILGEEVYERRVNITTPPDTEVAEVVRLLAERANLNFVYAAGTIRGRITLNLRDVPLGVALQSLLSTQDLVIVREGENVMRIAPRREVKPGTLVDTRTVYIKLNWVQSTTLETTLRAVLGTGNQAGAIKSHAETNTIIITDTAPNVALLRDLVTQLDVPEKQVMIEARMVELIIDNDRAMGSRTRLERRDSSNNSGVLGTLGRNGPRTEVDIPTVDGPDGKPIDGEPIVTQIPARAVDVLASNLLATGGGPSFSFGGVVSILGATFDVQGALDALENRRVVNVLANPRIITLNNQQAEIDIQAENPYLEAQQGVGQNAVAAVVKFKDSGVRLGVLPVITNNGYVRMRLTPEQRILAGTFFNPTTASDIPIVNRRTAVTNVIVKDEDTVVLGGLRGIDSSKSNAQVPWIGQAPIIGWFFKSETKLFRHNDLMLFVTPHIVKAPILTPAENYKYSRIDAHWDLPDYFFDDGVELREKRHRFEVDHNPREYYPQTLQLPPPVDTTFSDAELLGATQTVETTTTTLETLEPSGTIGPK